MAWDLLRTARPDVVDDVPGRTWWAAGRTVALVAVVSVLLGQLHPRYLPDEDRTATDEAADWLKDYLEASGGEADSKDAKRAGKAAGHSERTLAGARTKLRITTRSEGFPRSTVWSLPVVPTVVPSLGEGMTCTTDSGASGAAPTGSAPPRHDSDDDRPRPCPDCGHVFHAVTCPRRSTA